ncbi:MAG TPA: hypothetical protein VIK61_14270 [Acidimicrobiia bacterium]
MATLRDFVRRFRPAGAPGAAAPAGVPADRVSELTAELTPVFEELRAVNQEAVDLVAEAHREAERRRLAAAGRAEELLADARQRAEVERAAAAAAAVEAAVDERAVLLDRARRDAEDLAGRAAERMPIFVDRVVAEVRATGADREPAR